VVRFVLMPGLEAMLRSLVLSAFSATLGCASDRDPSADEPEVAVDIGLPAGDDGLDFESLPAGGELRLQTFGQGGTHVLLGVRTVGFGTRAFVAMTLRNLETNAEVIAPAPVRPQLFFCHDDAVCDLVPLLVMTAGLTETDAERNGALVEVRADVHNADGVRGWAAREAVLNTEDL
jgi:hypothetical protein